MFRSAQHDTMRCVGLPIHRLMFPIGRARHSVRAALCHLSFAVPSFTSAFHIANRRAEDCPPYHSRVVYVRLLSVGRVMQPARRGECAPPFGFRHSLHPFTFPIGVNRATGLLIPANSVAAITSSISL